MLFYNPKVPRPVPGSENTLHVLRNCDRPEARRRTLQASVEPASVGVRSVATDFEQVDPYSLQEWPTPAQSSENVARDSAQRKDGLTTASVRISPGLPTVTWILGSSERLQGAIGDSLRSGGPVAV